MSCSVEGSGAATGFRTPGPTRDEFTLTADVATGYGGVQRHRTASS